MEQLKSDISVLQQQLRDLTARKKQLATQYAVALSIHDTLNISSNGDQQGEQVQDTNPDISLADLLNSNASASSSEGSIPWEQTIYRLAGITGFKVSDPSPEGDQNMFGIRFDFDAHGKFVSPFYVILAHVKDKGGHATHEFQVFKHTIPAFIDIGFYAVQYLNHDIEEFVTTLQTQLANYIARNAAIDHLMATPLGNAMSIDPDPSYTYIDITASDGTKITLAINDRVQIIRACIMRGDEQSRDYEAEAKLYDTDIRNIAESLKSVTF